MTQSQIESAHKNPIKSKFKSDSKIRHSSHCWLGSNFFNSIQRWLESNYMYSVQFESCTPLVSNFTLDYCAPIFFCRDIAYWTQYEYKYRICKNGAVNGTKSRKAIKRCWKKRITIVQDEIYKQWRFPQL